jgi:hypothetical protein
VLGTIGRPPCNPLAIFNAQGLRGVRHFTESSPASV